MPHPKKLYAYCWANGAIQFGHCVPTSAVAIANGEEKTVRGKIESTAIQHPAIGLGVPGMWEAHQRQDMREKYNALARYILTLDEISCLGFKAIGA